MIDSTLFFIVAGVAVLLYASVFLINKGKKGVPRQFEYYERYFEWLFEKGFENGFLLIEHQNSEKFIQFGKYGAKGKEPGIEMSFPKANWSKEYFGALENFCSSNGYKYRINKGSDGMEFLNVNFEQDFTSAFHFAKGIVFDVFNIPDSDKFYATLNNCSLK